MSISGAIHAEMANKVKDRWVAQLKEAEENADLVAIQQIIKEMEAFQFSE